MFWGTVRVLFSLNGDANIPSSLLIEKNGSIPHGILSLLAVSGSDDTARTDSAVAVSHLLLERESNVNNQKLMGRLASIRVQLVVANLT